MGHDRARWGSVTFVQRFGSSLNLNPHVHVLMLDGVYADGDEAPVFVAAPPLSDQAVRQIVETSARRIIRLCSRHGLLDDTQADPLAAEEPVLAALVPPPRLHLLRYHGVLAPRARDRGRIVPAKPVAEPAADGDTSAPPCTHRLGWAALLARVFSSDLSACATCGGRLRIVAALTDPASIRTYLEGVGLPAVPPPRAPPQPQFEFAA